MKYSQSPKRKKDRLSDACPVSPSAGTPLLSSKPLSLCKWVTPARVRRLLPKDPRTRRLWIPTLLRTLGYSSAALAVPGLLLMEYRLLLIAVAVYHRQVDVATFERVAILWMSYIFIAAVCIDIFPNVLGFFAHCTTVPGADEKAPESRVVRAVRSWIVLLLRILGYPSLAFMAVSLLVLTYTLSLAVFHRLLGPGEYLWRLKDWIVCALGFVGALDLLHPFGLESDSTSSESEESVETSARDLRDNKAFRYILIAMLAVGLAYKAVNLYLLAVQVYHRPQDAGDLVSQVAYFGVSAYIAFHTARQILRARKSGDEDDAGSSGGEKAV